MQAGVLLLLLLLQAGSAKQEPAPPLACGGMLWWHDVGFEHGPLFGNEGLMGRSPEVVPASQPLCPNSKTICLSTWRALLLNLAHALAPLRLPPCMAASGRDGAGMCIWRGRGDGGRGPPAAGRMLAHPTHAHADHAAAAMSPRRAQVHCGHLQTACGMLVGRARRWWCNMYLGRCMHARMYGCAQDA